MVTDPGWRILPTLRTWRRTLRRTTGAREVDCLQLRNPDSAQPPTQNKGRSARKSGQSGGWFPRYTKATGPPVAPLLGGSQTPFRPWCFVIRSGNHLVRPIRPQRSQKIGPFSWNPSTEPRRGSNVQRSGGERSTGGARPRPVQLYGDFVGHDDLDGTAKTLLGWNGSAPI